MTNQVLLDTLTDRSNAANPELMASLGGMKVVAFDSAQGTAGLQFNCLPAFCHSNGKICQGGFVTAWLDASMAHVMIFASNGEFNIASLDINVRFFERVGPGEVFASSRIVRRGKKVAFLEAELRDSAGLLLASASSSTVLVPLARAG